MQVISFTCCSITVLLLFASVSCSDWVNSDGWREGLFEQCVSTGSPTPVPFGGEPIPGCRKAHSAGYIRATGALALIALFTDFFGTLLTGLGLRSTDPNKKYKYYRVAIYALLLASKFHIYLYFLHFIPFDAVGVSSYISLSCLLQPWLFSWPSSSTRCPYPRRQLLVSKLHSNQRLFTSINRYFCFKGMEM